jgi:hypothetical protein
MQTLQDITAAHSRRVSALHQRRDAALRDAIAVRDAVLRSVPAASALYTRFDKAVAEASDNRLTTEQKALTARDTALARAAAERDGSLQSAHTTRRNTDLDVFERRVQKEALAEREYRHTLSSLTATTPLEARQKAGREAERVRQRDLDDARAEYGVAIAATQGAYRKATDRALMDERSAERTAEQGYYAARRVAADAEAAAVAAAERELWRGLQGIAAARDVLDEYRATINRVRNDAARDEKALFEQFREELHTAER